MDSSFIVQYFEDMCARTTAIALWNQSDIRDLVVTVKNNYVLKLYLWTEIENTVIRNVSQISETETVKQNVLRWIKPIGLQILKWINHNFLAFLHIDLPSQFCWTLQKVLDERETAEMLIKDTNIDVVARYKLACIYCLEDDIRGLWRQIPENHKQQFFRLSDPINDRQHPVVQVWTYDINGKIEKLKDIIRRGCPIVHYPYQHAFEHAAIDGLLEPTVYFLKKLNAWEREDSLSRSARSVANNCYKYCKESLDRPVHNLCIVKEFYMDVLWFILSEIHEEKNMEAFRNCHCEVLVCFLDWPWQTFVMDVAKRLLRFFSYADYESVLNLIVQKVIDGYNDYTYETLFEKFWKGSQDSYRKYVINKCMSGESVLGKTVLVANKKQKEKFISIILDDADSTEKEMILFEGAGKGICSLSFRNNELDFLTHFVRKCISSQEHMDQFKEQFKQRELSHFIEEEHEDIEDKLNTFFQMFEHNISG